MAQTATNPDTGEKLQWDASANDWVPISQSRPQSMQEVWENMQAKSFPGQLRLGIGRGMVNTGRQIGNILGMVSDEEMEGYRQLDQPLMDTTGGKVGSVIGEVATLAPIAGGLVGAAARGLGSLFPAARTALSSSRMGQVGTGAYRGAAEGALEGAVLAGPGERGSGALQGAGFGAAGGAALPVVTGGFRTPTESARTVMAMEPSPDLTPGMMRPEGMLSQMEQSAGSIKGVGKIIQGARETPQRQFAQGMINEGRPPGTNPVVGTDVNSMLEEVYMAFQPAYDQLKGFSLPANIRESVTNDFAEAAQSDVVAATDDMRKAVNRYLANQATRLGDEVDSDDLLSIRSNIREQSRKAAKSQNWEKAELFDEAENAITERINSVLPEGFSDINRAIDEQYAKHKIAERAIYKMGNREYPTPSQWQQAIREATPEGQFARGGGILRPQSKAASDVFKLTEPATGARMLTWAGLGGGAAGVASGGIDPTGGLLAGVPLALLAATRGGRRFSVGETDLQRLMQRMSAPRSFMEPGIPSLPGMYARSIAPIAATEE